MTTAKYNELVQALTKQHVALTDVNGEFRSTYDIIQDIAAIWDDLSSMEQAGLATTISGTRQQAVFYSLVEQFQEASNAMKEMENSAGALDDAYAIEMESTTAHIAQFKAAVESLGATMFDGESMNFVVDLGTSLVGLAENMAEVVVAGGKLKGVLAAIAAILLVTQMDLIIKKFKGLGTVFKAVFNSGKNLIYSFNILFSSFKDGLGFVTSYNAAVKESAGVMSLASLAASAFVAVLAVGYLGKTWIDAYNNRVEEAKEKTAEAAEEAKQSSKDLDALIQKYEELGKGNPTDESVLEQIKDVQKEIVDIVGYHANNLDLVNGKYREQLGLLEQIRDVNLEENLPTLAEDYQNKKEENAAGTTNKAMKEALKNIAWYDEDAMTDALNVLSFHGKNDWTSEDLRKYYQEGDQKEVLDFLQEAIDVVSNNGSWYENDEERQKVINHLTALRTVAQENVNTQEKAGRDYFGGLASQALDKFEEENGVVESVDVYKQLVEYIKNYFADYTADEQQYALDYIKGEFPVYQNQVDDRFSKYAFTEPTVSGVSEAITGITDAHELMNTVIDEFTKTGTISADTMAKMAAADEDFMSYLDLMGDKLDLDTEKLRKNTEAKKDNILNTYLENSRLHQESMKQMEEEIPGIAEYSEERKLAKQNHADLNRTVYGNIDTDNRQLLEWTDATLNQFMEELMSWRPDETKAQIKNEFEGTTSTLFAGAEEFDGYHIAFTPILNTDEGAELLNKETVFEYLYALVDKAKEEAEKKGVPVDLNDIIRLDATGLEFDGKQIKGLVAGVANTYEGLGGIDQTMHYVGATGSVAMARQNVLDQNPDMNVAQVETQTHVYEQHAEAVQKTAEEYQVLKTVLDDIEPENKLDFLPNIGDAEKDLTKLGELLGQFRDDKSEIKVSDFSDLFDTFGDLDSFENFMNVLLNSKSTMEQAQAAADALGAEYLDQTGILSAVTSENAAVIQSMLEKIGVTNADVLVNHQLAVADAEAALAAANLANASWEDTVQFLEEYGAATDVVNAIRLSKAAHLEARLAALDFASATDSATTSIIGEMQAMAGLAEASQSMKNLISLVQRAASGDLLEDEANNYGDYVELYKKNILRDFENAMDEYEYDIPKPTISTSGYIPKETGSNNDSGKQDPDPYIADIEKFRKELEALDRVEVDMDRLQLHFDNEKNLEKQIELLDQINAKSYEQQQALKDLAAARKKYISEQVAKLRNMGFDVEWDPENNRLFVKNMEHVNELTESTKGEFDSIQENTNNTRKETEELIKEIESFNDENIENSQQYWEILYEQHERELQKYEIAIQIRENRIEALTRDLEKSQEDLYKNTHAFLDNDTITGFRDYIQRAAIDFNDSIESQLPGIDKYRNALEELGDSAQKWGNVDLNARTSIVWDNEKIANNLEELMSYEPEGTTVDELTQRIIGNPSAVYARSGIFGATDEAMLADLKNIEKALPGIKEYREAMEIGIKANTTVAESVFGNIDLNARQVLSWTNENLAEYIQELMSWQPGGTQLHEVVDKLAGTTSVVDMDTMESNGYQVAFTPILNTDDGAEFLSKSTVKSYIGSLFSKAIEESKKNGVKFDIQDVIDLDLVGLEVEGKQVSNIIGGIGSDAKELAAKINEASKNSSVTDMQAEIYKVGLQAGYTTAQIAEMIQTYMSHSTELTVGQQIAFSAVMMTEDGPVMLGKDTVTKYMNTILAQAGSDATEEEIIALDTKGIEIDGQKISNIIADVGDKVDETIDEIVRVGILKNQLGDLKDAFTEVGRAAGLTADQIQKMVDAYTSNAKFSNVQGVTAGWSHEFEALFYNIGMNLDVVEDFYNKMNDAPSVLKAFNELTGQTYFDHNDTAAQQELNAYLYEYQKEMEDAQKKHADINRHIFGNIDTDNRQMLQWTDENITKYMDSLLSWGYEGKTPEEVRKNLLGSQSTVLGTMQTLQGINIAFTPIMDTDDGPVHLSRDTVTHYLTSVLDYATTNAAIAGESEITLENVLGIDAQGLWVDGMWISNLIADIGSTAQWTAETMHFSGATGAIALLEDGIVKLGRQCGYTDEEVQQMMKDIQGGTLSPDLFADVNDPELVGSEVVDAYKDGLEEALKQPLDDDPELWGSEVADAYKDGLESAFEDDDPQLLGSDRIDAYIQDAKKEAEKSSSTVSVPIEYKEKLTLEDTELANMSAADIKKMMENQVKETTDGIEVEVPVKTTFGNVNLTQSMTGLTEDFLKSFGDAMSSWNISGHDFTSFVSQLVGMTRDMGGMTISFTPILNTAEGKTILSKEAIDQYLTNLITSLPKAWTNEDLMKLDAKGMVVDGTTIKNIILGIGETSASTTLQVRKLAQIMADVAEETEVKYATTYSKVTEVTAEQIDELRKQNEDVSRFMDEFGLSSKDVAVRLNAMNKVLATSQELLGGVGLDFKMLAKLMLGGNLTMEESAFGAIDKMRQEGRDKREQIIAEQAELHNQAEYLRNVEHLTDDDTAIQELKATYAEKDKEKKEINQNIVDSIKEMADQTNEILDASQNAYETLKGAANEYASNGGFLTLDTYQSIIALGPQYMQYLLDENGALNLNEQAIQKLMAAKAEQLAMDQAIAYITEIEIALEENKTDRVNELAKANTAMTKCTWGLIYARIEAMDVDEQTKEAIYHNVDAYRALGDAAVKGIGQEANAYKDRLTKINDANDDIVSHVKEMLSWYLNELVDKLEKMKDDYSDLID